ncbi:MAG TPA: TetR/AcrR family transcriptional regulator [Nitriliruptorales bacterium]
MAEGKSTTRRRGRPRKTGRTPENPRAEILRAAGRLFAEKGYEGTSTGEIAEAVGLTQPAIFYYFDSKEALFRELANESVDEPLAELEAILDADATPAAKLYHQIVFQVTHTLTSPVPLAAVADDIARLAGNGGFDEYFKKADRYTALLRQVIREGVETGQLRESDNFISMMAILGMSGWALRWFDASGPMTAEQVGHGFADFSLTALLRMPRTIGKVRKQAEALGELRPAAERPAAERPAAERNA